MEQILKAVLRYDGTAFAGWQRQLDERTIQSEIEAAMSQIAQRPITIQGAGRTDAGVHALGQVFSCHWHGPVPPRLRRALSQMLRPSIRILSIEEAPPGFNARFSALSKRYVYSIDFNKEADPLSAAYAWHVPYAVDLGLVKELLKPLVGTHDFAGFQCVGSQIRSTVRTIYEARLERGPVAGPIDAQAHWHLEFHGDGFLYKMVRNLAGTLIEIGRGRFAPSFLEKCLASPGPFRGHCAPPHGLFLASVHYE